MDVVLTEDGRKCIIKTDMVQSYTREPLLQCHQEMEENCHHTYVTFFTSVQEKNCEEFFEKKCKIVFNKKNIGQSVRTCVRPQRKVCDGSGPEECRTAFETSCTTQVLSSGI